LFPSVSETFVVSNIIGAIDKGYSVKILADSIQFPDLSSQSNLINKYNLLDATVSYKAPKGKARRYLLGLFYMLNPILLYYFIAYCRFQRKITWEYIFILKFYSSYRRVHAFHVHFATALDPLPALKEIKFITAKIVVTFHGYDAFYFPVGIRGEFILKYLEKHVAAVTTNSNYLKTILLKHGFNSQKISIVPIGIDTLFFKRIERDLTINTKRSVKIITVGRLIDLKGQRYGIEAIRELKTKGFSVNYTIVGDGDTKTILEKMIKDYKLESNVRLVGSKSQEEIRDLLSEADIFLITSVKDKTNRREAFGVVSLEAQAMNLPVVGFDSGGISETVENNISGFLVEEANITKLTLALQKLIENPELRHTMGLAARKFICENFKTEDTLKKYFDLYK
jgi:colanic acid/amylovoran biosynthesis glycosyltransferase